MPCGIGGNVWATLAVLDVWRIQSREVIRSWLSPSPWRCLCSGLNPLGKHTPSLISALQHSSGKPLTSGAVSTVLHKHSKFITQTPHVLSGFVQLFDKHSVSAVMGRTKENLSFQRRKIIWVRGTHSALDPRICLKMGLLTQPNRDPPSTRIPRRIWAGLVEFSPPGILSCGCQCCELELPTTHRERAPADTDTEMEMCARYPPLSAKTDLRKGREGTQTASTPSSDISAGLRLSNMSNYITGLLWMGVFAPLSSCTCSTELPDLSLFNSDYEMGPLLCTKLTSVRSSLKMSNDSGI